MGGIILICVLISIYLTVYWSIHIELLSGKTEGFFKFVPSAKLSLSEDKRPKKKAFLSSGNTVPAPPIKSSHKQPITDTPTPMVQNKPFLKRNKPLSESNNLKKVTQNKPRFNHHIRSKKE